MAVDAGTQTHALYARRARHVWIVLALSVLLFFALCGTGSMTIYGYLSAITSSQGATLQPISGSQLSVMRHGRLDREVVQGKISLNEGDAVYTGPDTEAYMSLFDGSTMRLAFNTHLTLDSLRISRFFGSAKDVGLYIDSGTAVLSTADMDGYSSASYKVNTPHAQIKADPNSTMRVHINPDNPTSTEAAVTAGSATLVSGGKLVELSPGLMSTAKLGAAPTDPAPDEQELIRNGDFTEPPTSRAEEADTGGLGTAAWSPIVEQAEDDTANTNQVRAITELVGKDSVHAAMIDREAQNDRYGRVGLSQDINASVSDAHSIELNATVKIVAQTEPVGGPSEDVFPLTIKVKYTSADGKNREWKHSFYYCQAIQMACDFANATGINSLGQYTVLTDALVLKRVGGFATTPTPGQAGSASEPAPTQLPDVGQDISVIDAIEIYGFGSRFQSWITNISLKAR